MMFPLLLRRLGRLAQMLLICTFIAAPVWAGQSPKITFSCWIPKELPAFGWLENLYRESFAAIGYEFTMVHYPSLRSLATANRGVTDGDCARIANYREIAPDSPLIRIEVMIAQTHLEAWTHDKSIQFENPWDLLSSDYQIGYEKGAASMQALLTQYPLKNLHSVGSIELGIKMLARKRFDIFISPGAVFRQSLDHNPAAVPLYSLGTLMVLDGHPYMHSRHRELIPAFTAELRKRHPGGGLNTLP